ncbi:multiple epidermal growth factor-like domains 11 [Plakobranchus ocellatus]|uniref:Multiple epidermal growth factor-like domains 11 n=1 Tax=Plakobranchus ocellatus TaxID=259542 RepID=A0AAV3YWV7_9GAST|nr:multiple epidermal growth factor-like domains 11 [Plakobranchus ocellatus]
MNEHSVSTQRPCDPGLYGNKCDKVCSTNCEFGLCDENNGKCLSCPHGKDGSFCNRDCKSGRYGHGCEKYCSSRCFGGSRACAPVDGTCSGGCKTGYQPPLCVDSKVDGSDNCFSHETQTISHPSMTKRLS